MAKNLSSEAFNFGEEMEGMIVQRFVASLHSLSAFGARLCP
jgi:hypothetical protein